MTAVPRHVIFGDVAAAVRNLLDGRAIGRVVLSLAPLNEQTEASRRPQ
jgi:hypothetical protein